MEWTRRVIRAAHHPILDVSPAARETGHRGGRVEGGTTGLVAVARRQMSPNRSGTAASNGESWDSMARGLAGRVAARKWTIQDQSREARRGGTWKSAYHGGSKNKAAGQAREKQSLEHCSSQKPILWGQIREPVEAAGLHLYRRAAPRSLSRSFCFSPCDFLSLFRRPC